jgi:molybdenum cofactor cytidylyltransferase
LKFEPVPVAEAEGAVLAHALRLGGVSLKKGHVIAPGDQAALRGAGVESVIAARFEAGDVGENEAARRLAERAAGVHLRREAAFTGRVNIFAEVNGLAMVDVDAVGRVNRLDEAITLATLAAHRPVASGDMVATVKIIPFAAPGAALAAACETIGPRGAVWVAPYRPLRLGVISTTLPALKASVIAKTLAVLEARIAASGATIAREARVPHEAGALAMAIADIAPRCDAIVIFGASAITDRRDVIPAAIEASGGRVEHFGMPVDPGNLLLLASREGKPIVGAPGCARSPKENGFDWVLGRILADVPIGRADIQGMGVGGLLMEIASRPQPRLGDG